MINKVILIGNVRERPRNQKIWRNNRCKILTPCQQPKGIGKNKTGETVEATGMAQSGIRANLAGCWLKNM